MKKLIIISTLLLTSISAFSQDIFQAARVNDVTILEKEISKGINIDTANIKGFTPLILAVYNESYDAASFLITKGASLNAQDLNGNNALMGAIFKGSLKMVQMLLENGADVNQQNFNGASSLIFAATFGKVDMIQALLDKGADLNIKDNSGKTALDHAKIQENKEVIALLQQYSK